MVNKERMLQEFFDLVRVTCHTGDEREMADLLKKKLKALGAKQVEEDRAGEAINGNTGNLVATFAATQAGLPTLGLSAHMDCVEPCAGIEPQLADGVITSRGATILGSDDKSGVAAILEGLRLMKENYLPHGEIKVVFCIAEEGGLRGSRNIAADLLQGIDYMYVLDGGGAPGTINNRAPGQNGLRVTMKGVRSHAGVAPEKGVNAIVMMGTALLRVPYGRIDSETTANIGTINGGIATNIVPDECVVEAEVRSLNSKKLAAQTEAMAAAFRSVVADFPRGEVDVEVHEKYQGYRLPETEPVVALAVKAAKAAGLPVKIVPTGGGSDANNFNKYMPAVVLGTGMAKVHTPDEFILEEHLYQAGKWVYRILEENLHAGH